MDEFLLIGNSPSVQLVSSCNQTAWSHNATSILIDLSKQHRNKVGTLEMRNLKKLWEVIASEINNILKTNFTPAQVENRWRVLERNYKKVIDNNNKTGRGRKSFAYEKEMDDIYGGKKNIHPELLLDSDTVHTPGQTSKATGQSTNSREQDDICNDQASPLINLSRYDIKENEDNVCSPSTSRLSDIPIMTPKLRRNKTQTKKGTLELMRLDKKIYYEENLKIQEKLAIEKEKLEVMKERAKERKRKNDIMEDRNKILKLYLENNVKLPDVM